MSRLKVWNDALGEWQYVGGQQPVLRYVPLDPIIVALSTSSSANIGQTHVAEMTDLPTNAVAVAVEAIADATTGGNTGRFNIMDYGGTAIRIQHFPQGSANYDGTTSHWVTLGGTNNRQFDYSFDVGTGGNTSLLIYVMGYWTYQAPSVSYPAIGAMGYGDTFPVSPVADIDRFFRTDLGMEFFWNGTRWLSTTLYHYTVGAGDAVWNPAISVDTVMERGAVPFLSGGSDIWLEDLQVGCFISSGGSALSASHKWTCSLGFGRDNTALTYDTPAQVIFDSGSSNVPRMGSTAINALMNNGTAHAIIAVTWSKTGTPGSLRIGGAMFTYRIVAT